MPATIGAHFSVTLLWKQVPEPKYECWREQHMASLEKRCRFHEKHAPQLNAFSPHTHLLWRWWVQNCHPMNSELCQPNVHSSKAFFVFPPSILKSEKLFHLCGYHGSKLILMSFPCGFSFNNKMIPRHTQLLGIKERICRKMRKLSRSLFWLKKTM